MQSFNEMALRHKVDRAMQSVSRLLENTRNPEIASDVDHSYTDKFLLTEFLSNASLASQVNALALLGVNSDNLATMMKWAESRAVSLRFIANEQCDFAREEKHDKDSDTKVVTEGRFLGSALSSTTKVVTTITEYFWTFRFEYQIVAFRGVGATDDDRLLLCGRSGTHEIKTSSDRSPLPKIKSPAHVAEVDITWLVKNLSTSEDGSSSPVPAFRIDRSATSCHTPRRNPEVDANLLNSQKLASFAAQASGYLQQNLLNKVTPALHSSLTTVEGIFVPVLPLMEDPDRTNDDDMNESGDIQDNASASDEREETPGTTQALVVSMGERGDASAGDMTVQSRSALLSASDFNVFIGEESRTLAQRIQESAQAIIRAYPHQGGLVSPLETKIIIVCRHLQSVNDALGASMGYIEYMMYTQLVAAIGKEVTPKEFAEYMRFHNRKLFAPAYAPGPFCFAVRRSNGHSPEGTLSIEYKDDSSDMSEAITTIVKHSTTSHRMKFALNAAAQVYFDGDRYLHAYLQHQFSHESGPQLSLTAKARQFSSMLVMLGRITAADTFDPKHAIIVQNKDELTIPLQLSTIPTPKEFKDAIESLSPEQQRFAKAFRSMQLESTLFGVLVIQIKPQLEKVLKLNPDSLTKELRLTQDLMDMFIKYQIPSDLLSCEGDLDAMSTKEKIENVRHHVHAMQDMLHGSKRGEIRERKMEADYERPRRGDAGYNYGMDDMLELSMDERPVMRDGSTRSRSVKYKKKSNRNSYRTAAAPPPPPAMAMAEESFSALSLPVQSQAESTDISQPEPAQTQDQQDQQDQQPSPDEVMEAPDGDAPMDIDEDYTSIPKKLDARFEALDTDSSLRPTIIDVGNNWTQKCKRTLLGNETVNNLNSDGQKKERDAAFDLLDALTRGGALSIDHATLHVVIATTHCFEKSVMNTVVQDNVSPIEKVERSELIIATTIHSKEPEALLKSSQLERIQTSAPMLFPAITGSS